MRASTIFSLWRGEHIALRLEMCYIDAMSDGPDIDPRASAEAVKAWRERLGLSQADAAERLGISRRQYQYYEAGEQVPPRGVRMLMTAAKNGLVLEPWPIGARPAREKDGTR